ncbi:SacI homology domain-domain-containing protein [Catenaria anguillulae PL171]|uniref:SacI homology domain-domain-containing protein n=1 Tax=Catenaria anguillulae PL171 TaxID=765915 RepID=A0A1Y2HXC3_9FUNG|nr:SacI homology domain-domain-containing protein [Catenaria anguillulae PL171]
MRYLTAIDIYETPSRLYAIGRLGPQGQGPSYRILKLDRTLTPPAQPCSQFSLHSLADNHDSTASGLHIHDDGIAYTRRQVANVLNMLGDSNDSVKRVCSGVHALMGVVRFVEGYYLIAIVQSTEVATLGPHSIRRVDETRLLPIANPAYVKWAKRADEQHYVNAFQTVALQQDLYFSWSYDVTRSLQHNILSRAARPLASTCHKVAARAMGSAATTPQLGNDGMFTWNAHHLRIAALGLGIELSLPSPVSNPSAWFAPVIQGFVGQVKLTVVGRPIYVTLIARRSCKFAGARFLRRGVDMHQGWVANEVESEQIVHDGASTQFPDLRRAGAGRLVRRPSRQTTHVSPSVGLDSTLPRPAMEPEADTVGAPDSSSPSASTAAAAAAVTCTPPLAAQAAQQESCAFCYAQHIQSDGTVRTPSPPGPLPRTPMYTSFIQHRGSIPLLWSQDNSAMTPKPPITLNIRDPYFVCAGKHFNRMFEHYGGKVICFNLIKTREKSKREMILGDEFEQGVRYLQQFLPRGEEMAYVHVDMSLEKKKNRVIEVLEQHAEAMVDQIGFFSSGPEPVLQSRLRPSSPPDFILARVQNGVIRTNCIDCLDRTNAAAFVIGKCALGRQLVHLGVLKHPHVPFDTEAIDLLTELYQDHGDAIALQYGGSALVNTMKTYRDRTLISQSRDMLESAKRYWSNSFSDADKQDAIDIFLGVFTRWGDFRTGQMVVPMDLRCDTLGPPWNYTEWRQPRAGIEADSSTAAGVVAVAGADEEEDIKERVALVSLADIYGADGCVVSQSTAPFKPHAPPDATMFDLSGLKKWLSTPDPSSHSLFSRDRTNSVSSFFVGAHPPDSSSTNGGGDLASSYGSRMAVAGGLTPIGAAPQLSRISELGGTYSMTTAPGGLAAFRAEHSASPVPFATPDTGAGDVSVATTTAAGGAGALTMAAAATLREYKRYVYQFSSSGLQLESRLPLLDSDALAHLTSHPDYGAFHRHVKLANGSQLPVVDRDDESLYRAFVDVPRRVARGEIDETEAWQQRIVAYEGWIAMGRLKAKKGGAAGATGTVVGGGAS